MKNQLKLVTLVLIITDCMLCGSLNAQQDVSLHERMSKLYDEEYKDMMRKKQQEYDAKFAKQKAQEGMSFSDWGKQRRKDRMRKKQQELDAKWAARRVQEEQEKAQNIKLRKENIQAGLITGGILAIPLIIVSITLIISRIKENRP